MAKEDYILRSFMAHPILKEVYKIEDNDLPQTVEEGIKSRHPVIMAIAHIVKGVQRLPFTSDHDMQRQVLTILNNNAV